MPDQTRLEVTEDQVAAARLLVQLDRKLGRQPNEGLVRIASALSEDELSAGMAEQQEAFIQSELSATPNLAPSASNVDPSRSTTQVQHTSDRDTSRTRRAQAPSHD